jgi:hypothetical protein
VKCPLNIENDKLRFQLIPGGKKTRHLEAKYVVMNVRKEGEKIYAGCTDKHY